MLSSLWFPYYLYIAILLCCLLLGLAVAMIIFKFLPLRKNKVIADNSYLNRAQSEVELRKFKLAVDGASDHIIMTDPDAKIIYANAAARKITGYSISEMIGNNPRLWGAQMPLDFYKNMWKTIKEDKKNFTGEITNRRKGGELYQAEIKISPILDLNGNVLFFVGIERDITEIKRIDRAKSEFVSLASHQLRTPLSAINWYSEMLLDRDSGPINDKQKDYLEEIYHSSKRMSNLVGELLNVSRIELGTFAIQPEPTDIVAIASSVIDEISHGTAGQKKKIVEDYDKNMGLINLDHDLMRIILQNLLSNSVKYTSDGGIITLAIKKSGSRMFISVTDNGYGIPISQQPRIFERFFRADNVRDKDTDGTGLGLYMVKEIVERSGGKIWFTSQENKETAFYISIPLEGMMKKEGNKNLQ